MNNSAALKRLRRSTLAKAPAKRELSQPNLSSFQSQRGFTLVEILVVVIIIGVLAAIAGPGWLSFVNQRRVGAANDVVLRALREAQSQAKNKKVSYSVSFRTPSGQAPEIAIYPTQKPDGKLVDPTKPADLNPSAWKSFSQDLGIKPGQVLLGTNLNSENTGVAGSPSYPPSTSPIPKITFDYMGTLPNPSFPANPNNKALIIEVGVPRVNSSNQVIASTRRCVKVITLLGSIQTGKGNECNP